MLRWYWYLCGSIHAKQTAFLRDHQDEDYEKWRTPQLARGAPDSAGASPRAPTVFHADDDDDAPWRPRRR